MSNTADTSVFRACGLRREYGKGERLVRAVDGVDLDIGTGETVAIMGPSGCGKSTLLYLLGGLDRAVSGVPGGFALFAAINAITGGDSDRTTPPSLWQLLALVLATVVVVAALTAVPARLGGRRPVTATL